MSEVDRLRVVYEVNDRAYTDAMRRMKATGETTNDAIVKASERGEKAVTKQGATTDAAVTRVVKAKKREEVAHKGAADAAESAAKRIVAANDQIERSTASRDAKIQNAGRQVGDIAVQVGMGTSFASALSMQLPQLLDGFGALGAVLGAVVAISVPLAASFIDLGDGSEELADATKRAQEALNAYNEAMDNSAVSAVELQERFGAAAGSARELLNVLETTARAKMFLEQNAALAALQERFSGLTADVQAYKNAGDAIAQENWAIDIANNFGLAIDQAQRLVEVLAEVAETKDAERKAALLAEMSRILADAAEEGAGFDSKLLDVTDSAARAALAVASIDGANLSNAMSQVDALGSRLDVLISKANSAAAALASSGVFVGSDGSIQTGARGRDPSTNWRFEDPNKDYDTIGERRAREAAQEAARKAREAKLLAGGGGGGGGRKSSKSGGSGKKPKVAEEAKLTREEIEALNETLYGSKEAQSQYEDAMSSIADTMAGVILEGESLRDGLASIFKGIANDILTSGIQQALMQSFGGSNWMMSLFGVRDPLTSALRGAGLPAIPSFDGGGFTGMGPRSGGLDGKGGRLAMIHPNETVLDHTKGQRAGSSATFAPTINVGGSVTQDDIARIHAAMEIERRNFLQNVRRANAEIGQRYN